MVVHCRKPGEPFRQAEQVFPASVLLRSTRSELSSPAPFVLQFFDPLRVSSTAINGRQIALERDITAPIAYRQSQDSRGYIEGFLQPGASKQNVGLFMIEPYQPGKIPVVFVHGLLSDPYTWANIANELRADPELVDRYQIWGFEYATGEPFLSSAATLRRQLREVQSRLDPTGSDPALSQMVLVGHSMGGLIAKLQVTYSGIQLWNAVSSCPFEQLVTKSETRTELAQSFFFEPSPSVSRIAFIGTPHLGSPWARRPIGRIGAKLVEESTVMQAEHSQLLRDNVGVFSREFTRRVPTSIDLLKPNSPLLAAINELPFDQRVPLHTIFGSGYHMLGAGDSDSVVPVESARIADALTEKSIHAKHTKLHQQPAGISELLCLLKKHLRELPAQFSHDLMVR
jgi:pimeloyl-ACP methyl ester carboxylesterase